MSLKGQMLALGIVLLPNIGESGERCFWEKRDFRSGDVPRFIQKRVLGGTILKEKSLMTRKIWKMSVVLFFALCFGGLVGCQIDLTSHLGSKAFYPDSIGDNKVGDPRRPMYEGSGYTEGLELKTTGTPGFQGMRAISGGGQ